MRICLHPEVKSAEILNQLQSCGTGFTATSIGFCMSYPAGRFHWLLCQYNYSGACLNIVSTSRAVHTYNVALEISCTAVDLASKRL